jgi:hypothetical protein
MGRIRSAAVCEALIPILGALFVQSNAEMHPIEAASVLSQLNYLQPDTVKRFAAECAPSTREFAPVKPYTPKFSDFTYASKLRLASDGPNVYSYDGTALRSSFDPNRIGKSSAYEHTLFLMQRDAAVLALIAKANQVTHFYCIRDEPPVKSALGVAAFRRSYNVNTVYPCAGQLHDEHVPRCICPTSEPAIAVAAQNKAIEAVREAAPFAIRLRELYSTLEAAHSAARLAEQQADFPVGTILIDDMSEAWSDLGTNLTEYPDLRSWDTRAQKQRRLALETRKAADAAEAKLALYIAEKEAAAFAVFKPSVQHILTTGRANVGGGYTVAPFTLLVSDIAPAYLPNEAEDTPVTPSVKRQYDGSGTATSGSGSNERFTVEIIETL